mmetsp:Transcript_61100/g.74901  ORF Transcript_61100/g.74901 Transcript_61100/m.74901 type:complete len:205 (+) Transcript_61100:722-1336(+)
MAQCLHEEAHVLSHSESVPTETGPMCEATILTCGDGDARLIGLSVLGLWHQRWSTIEAPHAKHHVDMLIHLAHLPNQWAIQKSHDGLADHVSEKAEQQGGPSRPFVLRRAEDERHPESIAMTQVATHNDAFLTDALIVLKTSTGTIPYLWKVPSKLLASRNRCCVVEETIPERPRRVPKEQRSQSQNPHVADAFHNGISRCKGL